MNKYEREESSLGPVCVRGKAQFQEVVGGRGWHGGGVEDAGRKGRGYYGLPSTRMLGCV